MNDFWSIGVITYYIVKKEIPFTIEALTAYRNFKKNLPEYNVYYADSHLTKISYSMMKIIPNDRTTIENNASLECFKDL